ncbi:MAG: hypothetical protein IPN51_06660 [Chloracidobacterium sp.]|nr:hypothetical protein [Chloracidobacterium sp.]
MNQDHLSATEVAVFREDSFSSRSLEIGRHLLVCKECRAKLPAVTPQEFRNCVLDADVVQPYGSKPKRRFFDFPILSFTKAAAFAGFAILLAAGIYFVGTDQFGSFETSVVKNENNTDGLAQAKEIISKAPNEKGTLPLNVVAAPEKGSGPLHSSKKTSQPKVKGATTREPKVQNAETRGNENPCLDGAMINLESNSDGKEVFLKWNAVKGAQSYAIYISDLDENLIDQFESKSLTNYRSKVKLDPAKPYRWKLIITLKNGNKIVGPPQVITRGTTTENSVKPGEIERKRASFELRCVSPK